MNSQFNDFMDIVKNYFDDETKTSFKSSSTKDFLLSSNFKISKKGESKSDVLTQLTHICKDTLSSSSPLFFNQLFAGRVPISVFADMVVPLMNISMYTYKVAGINVLIEKEVIHKFLEKSSFEHGDGIFTPGGSLSNLMAMVIARNKKDSSIILKGVGNKKLIGYTSSESHYSIVKNAAIIGIGKHNIRLIKTRMNGKMDVEELEKTIQRDIELGLTPFFVNVTAGTTVRGNFDSITEISKLCKQHNLWLHVDGSFGASVLLSKKYKHLMKDIEVADSLSWNAHKMMGVPLNASIFLVKDKTQLSKNFNEVADYLYQDDLDDFNLGKKSIQCGRRNDALKVWAAFKLLGDEGYEKRINKQFELIEYAKQYILEHKELELTVEPESVCLCFTVKNKSSSKICSKLNELGLIKVGHGNVLGKEVIRLVLINPDLTYTDINNFFEKVLEVA